MVKALYPIGKTQWAKWGDAARNAYNKSRSLGFSHETGVAEANAVQAKQPKKGFFDIIEDAVEDVAEVADKVSDVAAVVTPVVAVAKTVAKVAKVAKGKKGK